VNGTNVISRHSSIRPIAETRHIFTEEGSSMPLGVPFNVLVITQ